MIQRVSLAIFALALASACKTRNWDEGGILAEATPPTTTQIASGGDWRIACTEVEGEGRATYDIRVEGAVSGNANQPILVSVARKAQGAEDDLIMDRIPGRGAIDEGSSIFLGFHAGALTAEPEGEGRPYRGVLTLSDSNDANAVEVECTPTRT